MPTSIITNRRDLNWNGTMNIQQRLTKLEQKTIPPQDNRASLLIRFIDADATTGKIIGVSGILYEYGHEPQRLNSQELQEYSLGGDIS